METLWDHIAGGGATGLVIALCVVAYKALEVYLVTRKRKKLNGSADHHDQPQRRSSDIALGAHLERAAEVQRDTLELIRAVHHEVQQGHQRLETQIDRLPELVALHVKAGR